MRVQITLTSGAQIEFDAVEIETGKSGANEIVRLTWTTPENWQRKLHTLPRPYEIAAVVVISDREAASGDE